MAPLALDVAVPLGTYYALHKGLGMGLVASLVLSSVVPGLRTVVSAVKDRAFNGLAGLILIVNVAGIVLSFVTGDARLMLAKDSGVSSVIGLAILVSAFGAKPLMSAGLKPFLTVGDAARDAAWERLAAASPAFRRLERRFSLIWGAALVTECLVRLAGAFTLPVETMAWASAVILLVAVAAAAVLSGPATEPMKKMITAETGEA
ncbi:VC0807 family protein [Spirillospora sp. NPDC048911]|uniref:VC0807 family protein n=1 Tax=Spirillospora sp. NPDC048911 TaxID=3364527 RepID=UPI00371F6B80